MSDLVISEKDIERFWSKVNIKGTDDCWEWTGIIGRDNVGVFRTMRKNYNPYRMSYLLNKGKLGNREPVYHSCHNSKCVNPLHLYIKRQNCSITSNIYFLEYFWNNVEISKEDKCWNWKGSTDRFGYGRSCFLCKVYKAHQMAYRIAYGDIQKGMCVLHKCDNTSCCNPKHLWLGTQLDNIHDMVKKNRNIKPIGSLNNKAKLNEELVREIRHKYKKGDIIQKDLATIYNVSLSTIHRVISSKSWSHI
jgi:hypothetical protein